MARRSGAGGLNVKLGNLRDLAARLSQLAGGNLATIANQIGQAALPEVMAAEAARFDRRERADGDAWHWPGSALNRTGALRASMSLYRVDGSSLRGRMVPYGRYQNPPDFWPSPMPRGVREALERASLAVLRAMMGVAA